MSTTALAQPPQTPPAAPLRRYELSTTGGCEALMRVIGLIRRRGGEIVALDFDRGDRHRPTVLSPSPSTPATSPLSCTGSPA